MESTVASETSLLGLIDAQVRRTPDRVAIEYDGSSATYADIWRASGSLARELVANGVAEGDVVGVCVPRRVEMLTAVLGVLRAGAAYVPLDRHFPDRRLRAMVEQSGLRHTVVFGRDDLPAAVATSGGVLVDVSEVRADGRPDVVLPVVRGSHRAYVLFTSGSTGEPKGVCVLHRNLVNFMRSMRDEPGFTEDDVICAVTTLSFDIAALELYLALTVGARIVLAGDLEVHDPQQLMRLIEQRQPSVLQTTPTLLRLLVGEGRLDVVRNLKLLVGGEPLPRALANSVGSRCRELWNMYGPTETTIWSTVSRVEPGEGVISLGRPIANTRIHVLDGDGQPVAPGAIGEIWIGGEGVAEGYLGRPDLTAARFQPDPFAADGSRMYRTGDLGSLHDGVLQFHGRVDDQVKLRGFRIELGDIEAAAHEDPLVREAAAAVRDFGDGDQRLVLYVTARDSYGDLAARLRDRLRETLPAYMRPSHFVVLERIPTTPNGKTDRKALPMPTDVALGAGQQQAATVANADDRVAYLASVWRDLVGIAEVHADDNFFELGGNSLLAVDMMARVERETGMRLNILTVATGTLGSIAVMLPDGQAATTSTGWLSRLRGALGARRRR